MGASIAELMGHKPSASWFQRLEDSGSVLGFEPKGSILLFGFSVGESRGATKVEITSDKIDPVLSVLDNFDPDHEEDRPVRPMEEIIASTLTVEREEVPEGSPEGTKGEIVSYQFKTSDKAHSRTVVVPADQWGNFRNYLAGLKSATPALVDAYVKVQAEEDKRAAEKAARKAARENGATPAAK